MRALAMTWRSLGFPADFDAPQVLAFTRLLVTRPLRGVARQPDPVVAEMAATAGRLGWRLGVSAREAGLLVPQLHQLAALTVQPAARDLPALDWAIELALDSTTRPLRTDMAEPAAAALLTALAGTRQGEALVLSWLIGPWFDRPAIQRGDTLGAWGDPLTYDETTALKNKYAEPLYGAVARIGVTAATFGRQVQLAQRVLGALCLADAAGAGFTVRYIGTKRAARRLARHRGPVWRWPILVNAAELAGVLGWPAGNPHVPGLTYRGHRQLPPADGTWVSDAVYDSAPAGRYRLIGRVTFPGHGGYLHQTTAAAVHHTHVIGPTGAGKSALLARLIGADIDAGRSVVVIEPKADLIAAVIDNIPAHRVRDVVLIDPTDPSHAVGINILGAASAAAAADQFSDLVRGLWPEAWGPRTGQVLYTAALTLARAGDTLADLAYLLTDTAYRQRLVHQVADPLGTGPFWAAFDKLTEAQRTQLTGPTLNRLAAFCTRPALRAMIAQPRPRFRLADIFTHPRVVAVNAAKGAIGPESARLLGSLVLSQLWHATLDRATTTPPDQRQPVMLYVDEFGDYTAGLPVDFGDVLGQARGLGLALTVAHQTLSQLAPATRAGVLANARSRLVFQTTSGDDARHLAAALGAHVTPDDLAALEPFTAYAALVHDHATRPPASLATLPPTRPATPPPKCGPPAAATGHAPSPTSTPPSSPATTNPPPPLPPRSAGDDPATSHERHRASRARSLYRSLPRHGRETPAQRPCGRWGGAGRVPRHHQQPSRRTTARLAPSPTRPTHPPRPNHPPRPRCAPARHNPPTTTPRLQHRLPRHPDAAGTPRPATPPQPRASRPPTPPHRRTPSRLDQLHPPPHPHRTTHHRHTPQPRQPSARTPHLSAHPRRHRTSRQPLGSPPRPAHRTRLFRS